MPQSDYTGRYNKRLSTANLLEDDDEEPDFIPFEETEEEAEAGPRGPHPALKVLGVDMCVAENNHFHNTEAYNNSADHKPKPLIVRRGHPFKMVVLFNRPVGPDEFQIDFVVGGVVFMVNFGSRPPGSKWTGRIEDNSTENVVLSVTPPPDAVVGKFRTKVATVASGGMHYARKDHTDFYVLFNAWCEADTVFMADAAARNEYVMNDYGCIYMGSAGAYNARPWLYGQFEEGILDACIYILDRCRMVIADRGNALKVIRQASEMINAQDDKGVIVGNWGKTFPDNTSPLSWTGSMSILKKYIATGASVKYGQCWVFAGVFNTFLRCMGLPARVVTNFSSAHDNDGNLKTDIYYKPSGEKDPATTDSIWNFHVWNECFVTRPDLPAGLGGWQCVDATPQETSDGYYRCGPASVAAVKEGLVCYPYDTPFVFAEVNSDVIHSTRDKYGGVETFRVDTRGVGLALLTKSLYSDAPDDITHMYKNPEGSARDKQCMATAESFGLDRMHSDLGPDTISVNIKTTRSVMKGEPAHLELEFHNQGEPAQFQGSLKGEVVFYTGVEFSSFMAQPIRLHVGQNKVETMKFTVSGDHYMPHLGYQNTIKFTLTGKCNGATVYSTATVKLDNKSLNFKLGGMPKLGEEMFVEVSFQNPLNRSVSQVQIGMEGIGLFNYQWNSFGTIEPYGTVNWKVPFKPWRPDSRVIFAVLYCKELPEVWGVVSAFIDR